MSLYECWVYKINLFIEYIKPFIRMLCIWVYKIYVYIGNKKLRPCTRKMMPTIRLEKLYGYKRIYGNIYIVRLDNGQIIRARNIRFYKEDPPVGKVDEETLPKAVFDEEAEGLIFGEIIFGSGDRLLLFRTSRPSRP